MSIFFVLHFTDIQKHSTLFFLKKIVFFYKSKGAYTNEKHRFWYGQLYLYVYGILYRL